MNTSLFFTQFNEDSNGFGIGVDNHSGIRLNLLVHKDVIRFNRRNADGTWETLGEHYW